MTTDEVLEVFVKSGVVLIDRGMDYDDIIDAFERHIVREIARETAMEVVH